MQIFKVLVIIFFICIQSEIAQSQKYYRINPLSDSVSEITSNKIGFEGNYDINDSIIKIKSVNLIARVGISIYDLKNKKGGGPYSIVLVGGYRFSQFYFLGLGVGLNPINIGLYTSFRSGTILDNYGNSYSVDSINIHTLKSNYPIFLNQRINFYGTRKTSYSLNINSGFSLSRSYDFSSIYYNYNYLNSTKSEGRLTLNFYTSIGVGIKRTINRFGAVLLDFETDYISFSKQDNLYLSYFTIKIGYEFNTNSLKNNLNK